ncbi:hypothetical protein [uncultured Sphingomonas sp.]|uniref:hypothetical protein n=1 Tax=uncultured Sphingomonas sp. TaxID=158754 RepID=UPI002605802A|nr:hypothetical protein [uncultured Sphingomonas sp.]
MAEALPEGTDQIVPGASSNNNRDADDGTSRGKARIDTADLKDKASEFTGQAADKARGYAEQGKERASAGLDSFAKMIGDGAGQVDSALGESYGDYVRKAAGAVSDFSGTLRDKDVDELIDDARDLVRRSPAIAIGAAAAAGFVLARIIKAGSESLDETAKTVSAKSPSPKDGPSPKPQSAD